MIGFRDIFVNFKMFGCIASVCDGVSNVAAICVQDKVQFTNIDKLGNWWGRSPLMCCPFTFCLHISKPVLWLWSRKNPSLFHLGVFLISPHFCHFPVYCGDLPDVLLVTTLKLLSRCCSLTKTSSVTPILTPPPLEYMSGPWMDSMFSLFTAEEDAKPQHQVISQAKQSYRKWAMIIFP